MQHAPDRLATVAIGYGFAETAVTVSFLEAHGIHVVVLPYHLASISWDMTVALGGLEIRVPDAQAETAQLLLADGSPAAPVVAQSRWRLRARHIALVLIVLIIQVPPPARGIYFLARPATVEGSSA